jgi:ACS family pantothenate transporter-like MFS transporter
MIISRFLTTLCIDTFMAWIPLVWFQQVHQPYVTPGNRAAAVVASFNIIIFTTIALLAHREKLARKCKNQIPAASESPESETSSDLGNEKSLSIGVLALQPESVEASGRPI